MNIVLWAIQGILAIKCVTTAFSHALRQDSEKMRAGIQRMGAGSVPLLFAVSALLVLNGVALVLPRALGVAPWLTPLAAALLGLGFLISIPLHRQCRENPNLIPGIVLALLAGFLAYGRWMLAP